MKDLSFLFLIKKSMGAKVRKRFRNFCSSDSSTSTLNQASKTTTDLDTLDLPCSPCPSTNNNNADAPPRKSVTLEEMILQLEHEEEMARRATSNSRNNHNPAASSATLYHHQYHRDPNDTTMMNMIINHDRRMSCVNNSDILRSARNAVLNQYPRFSLDGKDSMYRSSFTNHNYLGRKAGSTTAASTGGPRKSSSSSSSFMAANGGDDRFDLKLGKLLKLPQSVGGESVIWCKPGVVAKLMGLDVMPLPINTSKMSCNTTAHYDSWKYDDKSRECRDKLCAAMKSQNLKRRAERHEIERRRYMNGCINSNARIRGTKSTSVCSSSRSSSRYCVMMPIVSMDRPAAAATR